MDYRVDGLIALITGLVSEQVLADFPNEIMVSVSETEAHYIISDRMAGLIIKVIGVCFVILLNKFINGLTQVIAFYFFSLLFNCPANLEIAFP